MIFVKAASLAHDLAQEHIASKTQNSKEKPRDGSQQPPASPQQPPPQVYHPQPQMSPYGYAPQPPPHSQSAPAVYGYGGYPGQQPVMVQQYPGGPMVMMMPQPQQPQPQIVMTPQGPMMVMPVPQQGMPVQPGVDPNGMMYQQHHQQSGAVPPQHQAMMPPVPMYMNPQPVAPPTAEDLLKTRRLYKMKHIPRDVLKSIFNMRTSELSTIEDFKSGAPLYKVTHNGAHNHFFPVDVRDINTNQSLYRITAKYRLHDKYILHQNATESVSGRKVASIQKNFTLLNRFQFEIKMKAGKPIKLEGDIASWSFTFFDKGTEIAQISRDHKFGITKKLTSTQDEYMVSVEPGTDAAFVLACAIIIDHLVDKHHHHQKR